MVIDQFKFNNKGRRSPAVCRELVLLDREELRMWRGKRSLDGSLDGILGESLDGSLDRDQRLSPEETLHTQLSLFHTIIDIW